MEGYVKIKKDGKLVFEGHNMIVNGGRDILRTLLLKEIGINSDTSNSDEDSSYNSPRLFVGVGRSSQINDLSISSLDNIPLSNGSNNLVEIKNSDISKGTENSIELSIHVISGATSQLETAKELGIYFGSGNSFTLFSRLLFDPIPFSAGDNLDIQYFIYF